EHSRADAFAVLRLTTSSNFVVVAPGDRPSRSAGDLGGHPPRFPVTPNPRRSRAAGSSPRRVGRNVARAGSIVVGRTNRVLITTLVLWAEANKQSSKHPTA